ncbi:MAG TPA: methyltransferase domain-containing protein [Thermoanaerobaculia bacterium]|nr:methyltransferase domain-containing protein [Thermoanaerobaculia bacterium]
MDLDLYRQFYAEEIRAVAHLRSAVLAAAFARVPRERFLGPGPWQILAPGAETMGVSYWTTPDADPRHLYHNVLVAIDPARQLNNGQPTALATWLDELGLQPGESFLHIGCGVGYYTAIAAEAVGPTGRVVGVEVDLGLAARARENLAERDNVQVTAGDGGEVDSGPVDAILVNAGATHPRPLWLDRLRSGGRLLLPLTFAAPGAATGVGYMLRIERREVPETPYAARFVGPVGIYHCEGARDPELNLKLREGLARGTFRTVTTLSRAPHEPGPACWLHGTDFCLQSGAAGGAA